MEDRHRYIFFHTLDAGGNHTTLGYTLPICPFTFIPVFDDGTNKVYSTQNIMWDFGDGTTSKEITASHTYSVPGWYEVKCYILGEGGIGYEDKFSQSILVKNYITDSIALTSKDAIKEAGSFLRYPKQINITNSWQTYRSISANGGYTINLQVSGANAPILNVDEYNKDKFGHLKPSARFLAYQYNNYTERQELIPINNLTIPSSEIYVKWNSGQLQTCPPEADGACFAGTSGNNTFYFNDDMATTSKTEIAIPAILFASFDKKQFKDVDNYGKSYDIPEYNILNGLFATTTDKTIEQSKDKKILTFSTNGMDDDNGETAITTFNISNVKYVNQKIPFVVRVKTFSSSIDENGKQVDTIRPSKYTAVLHYGGKTAPLTGTNITLQLKQGSKVLDDVEFFEELGPLSAENKGGYFRGYLVSPTQYENVSIHAEALPEVKERILAETNYAVIGEPQSNKIHNLKVQTDYNNLSSKSLTDYTFDTTSLTGVYTTCVTTVKDFISDDVTSYVWLVDSDSDVIKKYDAQSMNLVYSYSLSNDFGITYGSPSNIAGDKSGNVWITLYDSISTIKINNLSNQIDARIVSPRNNLVNDYENTVTPASVDTDPDQNVWISYSNSLSSFVDKYDQSGGFLFSVGLLSGYQPTELTSDKDGTIWCVLKDQTTTTDILSNFKDKVAKITSTGTVTYYNLSGSLWNITTDNHNNVWITRNRNQVTRINSTNQGITTFSLSSNSLDTSENYISDLEGITTTTDNYILVVDNANRCIHSFFAEENLDITETILPLNNFGETNTKITAYGDWNGYRMINKFLRTKPILIPSEGDSNKFSILSNPKYDIRKLSENFDPKEQLKSYRLQESLIEANLLFDGVIGSAIGTLSSNPNELGKKIYEKISNFTYNIAGVDTCNVESLKSMYKMLGEEFLSLHGDSLNIPADLYRLIDLFSINYSKLKGSRNKFGMDFDNKGYNNDLIRSNGAVPLYGKNKGTELDFFSTVLTAGNPIIAYERFGEQYTLLNTDLLSSSYINFHSLSPKTFSLSAYHPNWGWDLVLPNDYVLSSYQIPRYYTFYTYISGHNDTQTDGLINWSDEYTTISESLTSTEQWDEIKDNLITYTLAKGLNVIE